MEVPLLYFVRYIHGYMKSLPSCSTSHIFRSLYFWQYCLYISYSIFIAYISYTIFMQVLLLYFVRYIYGYMKSRQFLLLFWMFQRLVTVDKPCHVTHASGITTSETTFPKICFGVSKEWVRSWPHVFLITKIKKLTKKLLEVRPQKVTRREKKKKTRMAIAKLFALNANTKIRIG